MMGRKKLSEIRAELRAAFGQSDKELVAWFDQNMNDLEKQPKVSKTELETLERLRDALLRKPRKKSRSAS